MHALQTPANPFTRKFERTNIYPCESNLIAERKQGRTLHFIAKWNTRRSNIKIKHNYSQNNVNVLDKIVCKSKE